MKSFPDIWWRQGAWSFRKAKDLQNVKAFWQWFVEQAHTTDQQLALAVLDGEEVGCILLDKLVEEGKFGEERWKTTLFLLKRIVRLLNLDRSSLYLAELEWLEDAQQFLGETNEG